jgi:diguanylate cyclase (GGDEF)-like protein
MSTVLGRRGIGAPRRLPAMYPYLAFAATAMASMPLALTSQWGQTGVTVALGYAGALLCLHRYRTGRGVAGAWAWLGAGLALNASGRIWEAVAIQVFKDLSTPSGADVLYLAFFPCATVGLLKVVRARYPGLGAAKLIDAGTLTVGSGLLCWVFLIRPSAASASGSALARVVQVAYPVGDLMLLAILARIVAAEGWRTPSIRLMCLALLAFLLGDSAWALVNASNWSVTPTAEALLAEPSLAAFVLFGAAALHPSAEELEHAVTDRGERMSRGLLVSLALASLIAPVLLAGQAVFGRVTDGVAIALCSAQIAGLVIARMWFLLRHVQRQSARLRELALEDPLTGLPTRRSLQAYLGQALQRALRDQERLSVAMIDLDHFKRFNDEHGHPAGDGLLKSATAAWTAHIRSTDMLARVGGEEFVLVLPKADLAEAERIVAKLRATTPLGQTFSAGVATWNSVALPEELIAWADAAMYEAKRSGRDRTLRAATRVAAA